MMTYSSYMIVFLWACSLQLLTSFHIGVPLKATYRVGSVLQRSQIVRLQVIGNILTPEEFEEITTKSVSKVPCVIDFQKSECKPCKKIAPDYEALSLKYDGKVRFFKIDADTSKEALALMKANGVKSVPTFHVWTAGVKVDTVQGAHLDEVEETIVIELKKQSS